ANVNAAGLIQVAVGWSAEARRSSKLPLVARSTPETIFGRAPTPPPRTLFGLLSPTFNGKPDCRLIRADAVQPPMIQSATLLLLAYFRPLPNGSSKIGAMITRCGTSRMPLPYSDRGS